MITVRVSLFRVLINSRVRYFAISIVSRRLYVFGNIHVFPFQAFPLNSHVNFSETFEFERYRIRENWQKIANKRVFTVGDKQCTVFLGELKTTSNGQIY